MLKHNPLCIINCNYINYALRWYEQLSPTQNKTYGYGYCNTIGKPCIGASHSSIKHNAAKNYWCFSLCLTVNILVLTKVWWIIEWCAEKTSFNIKVISMILQRKFDAILTLWSEFDVPKLCCLSDISFKGIILGLNRVVPLLI